LGASAGGDLSGEPLDKNHRVYHGGGFTTTAGPGKGLFSSYGYMGEGSADPHMDKRRRTARGGTGGIGRRVATGHNGHHKGTFGGHPAYVSEPYVEAPGRFGPWHKGRLYTFTSRYERSARPHTSGVGRVDGRTLAQTKTYCQRRALSGAPSHGGVAALGSSTRPAAAGNASSSAR
jgi:hypothetical protein